MKAFQFEVKGNWAHFRKPETNNNPLTHSFITKTAMIGMIGAVLGIERVEMKNLFPQLSQDLLYGVWVKNTVKKETWAFTSRNILDFFHKAPKQVEFLRDFENRVILGLYNRRSTALFDNFQTAIERQEAKFTPVLGWHNCPAELKFVTKGELNAEKGNFATNGFVIQNYQIKTKILMKDDFLLGFEKIPSLQNEDFWNIPEKYVEVIFPTQSKQILGNGEYFQFSDKSQWVLI